MSAVAYELMLAYGNVDKIPDGVVIAMVPAMFWPIMIPLAIIAYAKDYYLHNYKYCKGGCSINIKDIRLATYSRATNHNATCPCCERILYYDSWGCVYEDYSLSHKARQVNNQFSDREFRDTLSIAKDRYNKIHSIS